MEPWMGRSGTSTSVTIQRSVVPGESRTAQSLLDLSILRQLGDQGFGDVFSGASTQDYWVGTDSDAAALFREGRLDGRQQASAQGSHVMFIG